MDTVDNTLPNQIDPRVTLQTIYHKKTQVFISDTPQNLCVDINKAIDDNIKTYIMEDLQFQIIYYNQDTANLPNIVPTNNKLPQRLPVLFVAIVRFMSAKPTTPF